ncbi:cation transporter, partial [Hymenobacter sp. UV11]|uniref:cation diffusion facilitator family transporter n=1 Tax=Hymenobacter sp. UV11 TaxID=1849735 RepID=UPI00105CA724
ATFIQSESAEYFHPETPAARQQANFLNQQRFLNPPKVESTTMMWVAGVGLLVNLYGVYLLRKSSGESLNMKGAYFEVLSDMLTSVGVLVAGVIMLTTKWYYADPLLSAGIGLFILPRTWVLLKEAVDVLLESTPKDVDLETLRQGLLQVPGVAAVHDLHAWVLTSGVNALSVHVVLAGEAEHEQVLARTHEYITGQHPIQHATIQVERGDFAQHETHQ